jgi:hypothetical protein
LLNRRPGTAKVNHKRVYRVMRAAGLLLERHTGRSTRAHARRPHHHAREQDAMVLGLLRNPLLGRPATSSCVCARLLRPRDHVLGRDDGCDHRRDGPRSDDGFHRSPLRCLCTANIAPGAMAELTAARSTPRMRRASSAELQGSSSARRRRTHPNRTAWPPPS